MQYPNDFINKIVCGDCLQIFREIPNDSVDLTLTSPPYDKTRKYNGFSFDFKKVAQHLFRITKPGGVLVWVVGDQTIKGSETGTSFKQALHFMEVGFLLYDTMIYAKNNPQPINARRYQGQHEYMFVFSKGIPKTVNLLMEDSKYAGKKNTGTMRNGGKDILVKKDGYGKPYKDEKIRGNIWYYSVGIEKDRHLTKNHPAIFPLQLALDHIHSWSNEGDFILDPFMGSGTVAIAAKQLNRNYIGIEISEEYCKLAERRLHEYPYEQLS